jgi:Ni/Co efflux regulator RcnB
MFGSGNCTVRMARSLIVAAAILALASSPGSAETKKTTQQSRPVQQARPAGVTGRPHMSVFQNTGALHRDTIVTHPGLTGGFTRPATLPTGLGGGFVRSSVGSNGFDHGSHVTAHHSIGTTHFTYRGHSLRRIGGPAYRWPFGYRYTRYEVGGVLPRTFWVPDYYVGNYAVYGLDAPPPGFEWVRYGSDLLLVDLTSGSISQVVYGAYDDPDGTDASADAPPAQ